MTPPTQSKYLLTKLVWGSYESLPHLGQFARWKKSMHGDTWSQLVTSCSTCRHNPKLTNVGSRGKLVETKEFIIIHFQNIETEVKLPWNNVSSSYLGLYVLTFSMGGGEVPWSHFTSHDLRRTSTETMPRNLALADLFGRLQMLGVTRYAIFAQGHWMGFLQMYGSQKV